MALPLREFTGLNARFTRWILNSPGRTPISGPSRSA